jgi:hypothetical protein
MPAKAEILNGGPEVLAKGGGEVKLRLDGSTSVDAPHVRVPTTATANEVGTSLAVSREEVGSALDTKALGADVAGEKANERRPTLRQSRHLVGRPPPWRRGWGLPGQRPRASPAGLSS